MTFKRLDTIIEMAMKNVAHTSGWFLSCDEYQAIFKWRRIIGS